MSTKTVKFDNFDRARVKEEIERLHGITLHKKSNRDVELVSDDKKLYWIIGGTGEWHGIPPDMIDTTDKDVSDGVIVIASKGKTKIRIFEGPLFILIQNKQLLNLNKDGIYQLDVNILGNRLTVKRVPSLYLSLVSEIKYSDKEKTLDKVCKKVTGKLSVSELQELLSTLEKEN